MNRRKIRIITSIIYCVAMIALTIIAIPFIKSFKEPEEFKSFITDFGGWSFFVVLFIQVAQIVVALIPGEVVEFLAGTLYGWFGGLMLCLSGIAIGQTLIFRVVNFFGKDFVEMAAGSKAMNNMKFLKDEKKLKFIIFFLFFIPGTPKDLITYIVPLTSVSLRDFLVLSLIARIPSVVSSTFAGDLYIDSNFTLLAVTYGVIILFSCIGICLYKLFKKTF